MHLLDDGSLPSVPEVSAPRRPTDAAKPLVSILLYLVSVGFVGAAIIGICFGTGFFLLASPAGDFDRNPPRVYGAAPDSGREAVLVSQETGMPHSAALAALPGSSAAEPPAMGGSAQVSPPPVPPSTEPPTQIAPVLGPAQASRSPLLHRRNARPHSPRRVLGFLAIKQAMQAKADDLRPGKAARQPIRSSPQQAQRDGACGVRSAYHAAEWGDEVC